MSRITSNEILLVTVILSIIFFVLCLLQFFIKCIFKRSNIMHSGNFSEASNDSQIQLQNLFRQHDSGLDQSVIDSLPVFYYKEIVGSKEPFDCAVCLSEFADNDELKLLVNCSHAFHTRCIETWLMSNSSCPLCRRRISYSETPKILKEYSVSRSGEEALQESAFPVRLGKFGGGKEEGGSSSSSFDARRCYSMGAFHYIVGEAKLQVTFCGGNYRDLKRVENDGVGKNGGKISVGGRGESLSVSKIWLWSKKDELGSSLEDLERNGVL